MNLRSVLLVSALAAAGAANAVTLASWGFETSAPVTAGPFANELGGVGNASSVHSDSATAYSSPSGNASTHSFSANTWNVGDYFQFTASTTGYNGLGIAFDQTGSNTGPANFKLSYSTDGTTFIDVTGGAYSLTNDAWSPTVSKPSTHTFDLSAVTALSNKSLVYFRLFDTSTVAISSTSPVAAGGTSRVDNVLISGNAQAVPEPSALAALGLGAVAMLRRRRSAK